MLGKQRDKALRIWHTKKVDDTNMTTKKEGFHEWDWEGEGDIMEAEGLGFSF